MMHNIILNSKRYSTPLGTMFNKVARIIYVSVNTRFAAPTYYFRLPYFKLRL